MVAGCSVDQDADVVNDEVDNCPSLYNPEQVNSDGDLMGDACDADADDDGILNHADNCGQVANVDQRDEDRDGLGDVCDSTYCYVADEVGSCLDPATTFTVYGGADRVVHTGETIPLLFWANRKNRGIEYEWIVDVRPGGSHATVKHPRGSAVLSTPYNYHYKKGRLVEFTPDKPGEYQIRIRALLVFEDDLYPDKRTDEHMVTLTAEGDPVSSGCSTLPASGSALGLLGMLLGLASLWFRRK